ncbi:MAG: phosphatidate cytidylyltransferase [Saprospiraceae bacterium]|nr:phosphatidate cytidylyltransferase [Saprospiraceae bacterium]
MKQRVISAIFFVIIMLGGIFSGAITFFLLFLVITAGCLWEFTGLMFRPENNHLLFRRVLGTVLGCLPFIIMSNSFGLFGNTLWLVTRIISSPMVPLLLFFLLFIVELFLESRQPFANMGHYLLGAVYVGIPFALLVSICHWQGSYAPLRVLGLLLLTWTNDTMAYVVGSQIGKTPFFPRISPKKTWEGTLGGMVFTFLLAGLFSKWIPDFSFLQWMWLAAAVAIFGTVGDLVESMLKRSMDVKDSGSIMPGHGGFLDRFDSFIFVLPFAWLALVLLQL